MVSDYASALGRCLEKAVNNSEQFCILKKLNGCIGDGYFEKYFESVDCMCIF
jgi:hypothetical protein